MDGAISRARFEKLLMLCLERVRVGSSQKAKLLIGAAWTPIVNDMYKRNAERLSANQFAQVLTECAATIVDLLKNLK
jgi:hypothetical protein